MKLFEVPVQEKKVSKFRCKSCDHIYKHMYNDTKYCSKQKSNFTAYGNKKIKANDYSCEMYEKLKED